MSNDSELAVKLNEAEIVKFLARMDGFREADNASLVEAAKNAKVNGYTAATLIIKQGERDNDLHLLYSGIAQVPIDSSDKRQKMSVELGAGNIFGEMGFITEMPRSRNVVALSEVVTLSWSKDSLYFLLSSHPPLAQFLSDTIGARLSENGLSQVGKYQVVDKLGQGSTSQVYHAYNRALKRPVAIKMLNHSLVFNKQFRDRFIQEAQIIATLSHPNIVQIFDMESHYATYFMIMEFIEGCNLLTSLKDKGPMSVDSTLSILLQVAEGLSYSHNQGIVHGDIKPANCMITPSGTVKLMDFGVGRFTQMNINEHEKGLVFGTPDYLAPEVLMGAPIHQGSDIYALGIMTYQLLTGECPFTSSTIEKTAKAHIHKKPPRIEDMRSDISSEFASFIHGALEKNPDNRFQSWEEVKSLFSAQNLLAEKKLTKHVLSLTYPKRQSPQVEEALETLATTLRGVSEISWEEGFFWEKNRLEESKKKKDESPLAAPLSWLYDKVGFGGPK